jgi:hypothetical protein
MSNQPYREDPTGTKIRVEINDLGHKRWVVTAPTWEAYATRIKPLAILAYHRRVRFIKANNWRWVS